MNRRISDDFFCGGWVIWLYWTVGGSLDATYQAWRQDICTTRCSYITYFSMSIFSFHRSRISLWKCRQAVLQPMDARREMKRKSRMNCHASKRLSNSHNVGLLAMTTCHDLGSSSANGTLSQTHCAMPSPKHFVNRHHNNPTYANRPH